MDLQREASPSAGSGWFLADGGGDWQALRSVAGRSALREHLLGLLELARTLDAGFILDVPVYRGHGLPLPAAEIAAIDLQAIAFARELRAAAASSRPVLLRATLAPFPEWNGEWRIAGDEDDRLPMRQFGRLAASGIDLVGGPAFAAAAVAANFIEAARGAGLAVAPVFAIDGQGCLADGQPLGEAIEAADTSTLGEAAWFGVQCAGPDDLLAPLVGDPAWSRRIRSLRVEQAGGDPVKLRQSYAELATRAPWIGIADLAGGRALRHAAAMAGARRQPAAVA